MGGSICPTRRKSITRIGDVSCERRSLNSSAENTERFAVTLMSSSRSVVSVTVRCRRPCVGAAHKKSPECLQ